MASIDATRHVLRYRCENASGLVCESSFPLPAQPLAEGDAAESNVRDVFPSGAMERSRCQPRTDSTADLEVLYQGITSGVHQMP
jgi:hypothetical protein